MVDPVRGSANLVARFVEFGVAGVNEIARLGSEFLLAHMFTWTDTEVAPWTVIKSNDKKRARVNAMRHVLSKFDYADKDYEAVGQPDPLIVGRAMSYD